MRDAELYQALNLDNLPGFQTSYLKVGDFSERTTDRDRDRWTLGKLRHVVKASAGRPMIVTIEGLMYINVRLVGTSTSGMSNPGPRIHVEHAYIDQNGERKTQVTWYLIDKLGPVIGCMVPWLADRNERGDDFSDAAVRSYREEIRAAINLASERHGDAEGRSCGRWSGKPGSYDGEVWVEYEPHTGNPAYRDRWGTHWAGGVKLSNGTIGPVYTREVRVADCDRVAVAR
jgi:hypothetical protein